MRGTTGKKNQPQRTGEKNLLNTNPQSVQEEIITSKEETAETSSSDEMEQNKPSGIPAAVPRPKKKTRLPERLHVCYLNCTELRSRLNIDMHLKHFLSNLENSVDIFLVALT